MRPPLSGRANFCRRLKRNDGQYGMKAAVGRRRNCDIVREAEGNSMSKKVSVIVPVYNSIGCLERCVQCRIRHFFIARP